MQIKSYWGEGATLTKGIPLALRPVDTCIFDRYEQVNNILNYIYDIFGQNEESLVFLIARTPICQ